MTPPRSNSAARINRSRREDVARRQSPELGRETQRFDVDALVVSVEHRAVVVEADAVAEQSEAVGGGAQTPEEAGVGGTDSHERHRLGTLVERSGEALQPI